MLRVTTIEHPFATARRVLGGLLLSCLTSALVACGGGAGTGEPVAAAPVAPHPSAPRHAEHELATSAEIGALNERAAEESFRASIDGLQQCVSDGVERLEFMGGSIEFAVKIDAQRQVSRVWAAHSSLGERSTEKCMFEALRAVDWPAPEGGQFGIARNSFEFEPRKGSPTPAVWDAGRVAGVVDDVQETLAQCGDGQLGHLLITLYIGEGGKALAGGAASEEPVEEAEVDCVVDALLSARYPRPERTPTKVRFNL
jgi:hypothetical protein